jgi:hypothetical protein
MGGVEIHVDKYREDFRIMDLGCGVFVAPCYLPACCPATGNKLYWLSSRGQHGISLYGGYIAYVPQAGRLAVAGGGIKCADNQR